MATAISQQPNADLAALVEGLARQARDPLNGAYLNLALADRSLHALAGDVSAAREALARARADVTVLSRLVTELLEYARLDPLRIVRTDLVRVARAVIAREAPDASPLGVEIDLDAEGDTVLACDAGRIGRALRRTVRNAVEATAPGGHVVVRVSGRPDGVHLTVEDDGSGLPGGEAGAPFFSTKPGRVGLGLALAARTAAVHGGRFAFRREDGRTIAWMWLPHDRQGTGA